MKQNKVKIQRVAIPGDGPEGPVHFLSLGAGVQSSTLALMFSCGEIQPMPFEGIFADTQAEPKSVYRWLDWLEENVAFPIVRVTNGSLEAETLKVHARKDGQGMYIHSGVPHYSTNADGTKGHGPRQCTDDFKLQPLLREQKRIILPRMTEWRRRHRDALKALTAYENEKKVWKRAKRAFRNGGPDPGRSPTMPVDAWNECQHDPLAIAYIGISWDEAQRMRPAMRPWIRNEYPLVDRRIKRRDCLQWMESRGFPKPPRSACVFCPYHSDVEWLRLKTEEPEEFQRAVEFERKYQAGKAQTISHKGFVPYLHEKRQPLDTIEFDPNRGQPDLFGNDCKGMCGV